MSQHYVPGGGSTMGKQVGESRPLTSGGLISGAEFVVCGLPGAAPHPHPAPSFLPPPVILLKNESLM